MKKIFSFRSNTKTEKEKVKERPGSVSYITKKGSKDKMNRNSFSEKEKIKPITETKKLDFEEIIKVTKKAQEPKKEQIEYTMTKKEYEEISRCSYEIFSKNENERTIEEKAYVKEMQMFIKTLNEKKKKKFVLVENIENSTIFLYNKNKTQKENLFVQNCFKEQDSQIKDYKNIIQNKDKNNSLYNSKIQIIQNDILKIEHNLNSKVPICSFSYKLIF
jgi:hypothetical protein